VSVSGTTAELVQRLIEVEQSEDVELPAGVGINMQKEETMPAQSAAISQLQNEVKELKARFITHSTHFVEKLRRSYTGRLRSNSRRSRSAFQHGQCNQVIKGDGIGVLFQDVSPWGALQAQRGSELQNSIAAIHFATTKHLRDAAESYIVNRGRPSTSKKEYSPKASNFKQKPDSDVKPPRSKESVICYNCGERGHFSNSCPKEKKKSRCTKCNKFHEPNGSCQATNVMRLGAANQDKFFTRKICVHSHDYNAFIYSNSQASLIRQSDAEQINAKRLKCSMKNRGICGRSCILTEAMTGTVCESRECGRVLKSLRSFLKVFSIKPEVQPAIRRGALGTRTWTSAYGREAVDDIQEQLGNL